MNDFSLSFQSGFIILYIIAGLTALGISWWSYRNLVPQVSRFKRAVLIALRSLGIFLITLLLLEPIVTRFSEKTIGNKLGVIFDLSSSMQLDDNTRKRSELAAETFISGRPDDLDILYFGFADSVMPLKNVPGTDLFTGKVTNMARAIAQPVKTAGDEVGALLLVTDGAGNIGTDPLIAAGQSEVPVYSLVVGKSVDFKDVAITGVDYPPVGYINTEMQIGVEVKSSGYEGQSALVEIRDNRKTVGSKTMALPSAGAYATVTFPITFTEAGARNLKAVVSPLDDEAYSENNTRNFAIKLLKDKTRILLMASSLNWEYTFLKRALDADSHFEVISAIAGLNNNLAARDLPADLESWRQLDLIIVLDLAARSVGPAINNLQAAVESGTGFLFVAGDKTRYDPGGDWDEILPIATGSVTSVINGEFFPVPGQQALARTITDIEGIDWDQFSPLEFVYKGLELKPNAVVFLGASDKDGVYMPVLAGGFHKTGKTAAMIGYPWWKRSFRPEPASRSFDGMKKFWGNLVRWLVAREDMDKFNLASGKPVYRLGEQVEFYATLFDESYNLLSGAQIIIQISDSTGAVREFRLASAQAGRYSGAYGSPTPGQYQYTGYAVLDNDTLGHAAGGFIVEAFGLELENPSANYSLMRQIASITGGESYTVDDFSNFRERVKLNIDKVDIFREFNLTGNTFVLMLILAMFILEWAIRKFSQLA